MTKRFNSALSPVMSGLLVLSTGAAAQAQMGVENEPPIQATLPASPAENEVNTARGGFYWGVNAGGSYQASTGVDGGGRFSASRYSLGVGGNITLSEELDLNFGFGYERHEYRFSSVTRMGNDPWENINILGGQASLAWQIDEQWKVHAGPLVSFAAEDAADWNNAFSVGVAAGVEHQVNDQLRIGVGLGVITRIEDDLAAFPIFYLNWQMTDQLVLRTGSFDLGVQGGAGLELAYQPHESIELAAGVQYQNRRFRLDNNDIAPDGVGEESAVPIYARATWNPCSHVSLSGFAGVLLGGRLELDDEDGHNITRKNFDPAAVVGGRVSVRF